MAMKRVCNKCDKVIEDGEKFWTGNVTYVDPQASANPNPTAVITSTTIQFDYHEEHLPKDLNPEEPAAPETPSEVDNSDAT